MLLTNAPGCISIVVQKEVDVDAMEIFRQQAGLYADHGADSWRDHGG